MIPKRFKRKTAAELMAELEADPEWVRARDERERQRQEFDALLAQDEAPLVSDLSAAGYAVESVWDLVNTSASYPEAWPVLIEHLQRPYHPRTLEGIARALTVPEAGEIAFPVLLRLLDSVPPPHPNVKWAIANALTTIADKQQRAVIKGLLKDERHREVWGVLKRGRRA